MNARYARRATIVALASCLLSLAVGTGCASLAANLIYMVRGNKVPAKCTALQGKRVAVVVVDASSFAGTGGQGDALSRLIAADLKKNVSRIKVVPPDEVGQWRDANNWNEIDYRAVGKGLKADMVLAVDLMAYTIHPDQTLLQGKSRIRTVVYDIANDEGTVFNEPSREHVYPENSARHAVENESEFERVYLLMLARNIARNFYAYDKIDDVAADASFLGD